jgi:hypothetical protein
VDEARVLLRHRARPVSARGATPFECIQPEAPLPENVTSFAAAVARLKRRTAR